MVEQKARSGDRLVSRNKRAYFDYEIGECVEAGVVLIGSEVRSLRESAADLTDAWILFDSRNEAWLKGVRIPSMKHATFAHAEKRDRKLLLKAKQIEHLKGKVEREGMTMVATRCFFRGGYVKIEVALARGKKEYDKRHAVKEREAQRETRAAILHGRNR